MSPWPVHARSTLGSCPSSLVPSTEEAKSEASWTALAKENERDWWSIDLEGEVEELEVGCLWPVTKGGSMDP